MNKHKINSFLDGQVNLIEDFITKEICDSIYSGLDKTKKPGPYKGVECALGFEDEIHVINSLKNFDSKVHKVALEVREVVSEYYKKNLVIKNCVYVNMLKGGSNPFHTDMGGVSSPELEKVDDGHNFEFSGLVYLNDNYSGGELSFSEYNFKIKPKTGSLVFFNGHEELGHEVLEVLSGERKNIVMFFGKPNIKGKK